MPLTQEQDGPKTINANLILKAIGHIFQFLKNSTSQKLNMLNCIHSDPTRVNSTK